MPAMYLLCGLPGSGKSFWAQQQNNFEVINLDKEFFKKYGEDWDKKKFVELEAEVKKVLIEKAKKFLSEGKNVILDYGFWKKKDREEYMNLFKNLAKVKVVYFDVPKEQRFKRALGRDKTDNHDLNQEALETFEKAFEIPTVSEFAKIEDFVVLSS